MSRASFPLVVRKNTSTGQRFVYRFRIYSVDNAAFVHKKARNAFGFPKAFSYMNLIEHWGSGIPRIIGKVKAAGLREPEFIGGEVDLRINIYRGGINGSDCLNRDMNDHNSAYKVPDSADKMPDSEQEQRIYEYVLKNGSITTNKVMELLNVKERRARIILQSMIEKEWLRKTGAARSTIYLKNTAGR